mgnify:CR=1 FL=1
MDDDEPWDMRFHFQGCDNLERTLCESDITYINMLAIIGIEGYTTRKRPTNGAPNLAINGALVVRH